ncbi:MAG: diadenylate cyclase CdaA [Candidatus Electryoneaceae bacterium]|nr:diadenylate cyclase CdaA [Candidatus Electryoneaceae bacterium]
MTLFNIGFISFGLIDLVDIVAVTVIFYQIYRIMRGTRATQMFVGSLVLLITGSLAQLVGMSGLTWLIQSIGAVWVIAFVILFQPELRRVLIQVGQLGVLRKFFQGAGKRVVTEVSKAALELSRRRFGGLIVFQRTTGLRGVVETGIPVQAEISAELIISIFFPRSPMHDGAVIIANETVIAAKCILPMSTDHQQIESSLGTRHRAALSISEEVDAVVVVISEETGSVSVVVDGDFVQRNLDEDGLKIELTKLLYPSGSIDTSTNPPVHDTPTTILDPGPGVVS